MATKQKTETVDLVTMVKDGRTVAVKLMHVPAWQMMGYKQQDGDNAAGVAANQEEVSK